MDKKGSPEPLEIYKGRKIYSSNFLGLRVSATAMKNILDAVDDTGFSVLRVLSLSSSPCDKCKNIPVEHISDDGIKTKIKRGILSYRLQGSGANILRQKKK